MCSAVRRRMLSKGITSSRFAVTPLVTGTGAGDGCGAGSGSGTGNGDGAGSGSGAGTGSGPGTGSGTGGGSGGVGSGVNVSAGDADGAAGAGSGARVPWAASRTSLRVIRPTGPLPRMVLTSRPRSATSRRTIGDVSAASEPAGSAAGDGLVVTGSGAGSGAGGGAGAYETAGAGASGGAAGAGRGSGSGAGAGGAAVAAAGAAAAEAASPSTARRVPTSTVSPSGTRISEITPATGAGTSESTLSVETSNRGSSASTCSPTFFSQRVIVPSVTVSPSWGIVTSTAYSSGGGGLSGSDGRSVQRAAGDRERGLAEHLAEARVRMDE